MIWLILSAVLVFLDQFTKRMIINNIGKGEMVTVIEKFFYLTNHENSGAAWGIFKGGRWIFISITIILIILIIYFIKKSNNKFQTISLAIILGGAVGNVIGRIYKGSVTDYLDFYIGNYNFPTFNIADSCVVIGTILLSIYILFIYKEKEKKDVEEKEEKIKVEIKNKVDKENIIMKEANNNKNTEILKDG